MTSVSDRATAGSDNMSTTCSFEEDKTRWMCQAREEGREKTKTFQPLRHSTRTAGFRPVFFFFFFFRSHQHVACRIEIVT